MPLTSDSIFGVSYISPNEFSSHSDLFGVSVALPDSDDKIQGFLSAATLWINANTQRNWDGTVEHDEQHLWDPNSRRIYVNFPPVSSVTTYEIFTGANVHASFDPDTAVFINGQSGYLELSALSVVGPSSALLLTGINEPVVHIVYKSIQNIPENVKLATGYIAASMMNSGYVEAQAPGGLKDIKIGSMASLSIDTKMKASGVIVPSIVNTLLANEINIGIS
jgi:hypothetical protein